MKTTPWAYRKASTPLHKLPAGIKIVFLLLFSLAAFFPNLAILACIAIVLFLLSFIAGIGPRQLLRGSGPLFFVVLAVFFFEGVELFPPRVRMDGLLEAVIFCARIGVSFAAGSLLFSVTTSGEIRKSLSRAETFLRLQKLNLTLYISLMLGFIPEFFQIWEDIHLAWKSRAGKKTLRALTVLVPLVIERMMRKAADKAAALESRGALL